MQKIVPEAEWDAFMTAFRTPLPSTFRICRDTGFADQIRDKMIEFSKGNYDSEDGSTKIDPPKPLPW